MTLPTCPCLLYGVFVALREAGAALNIRDYLDGLEALRLYGGFPDDLVSSAGEGQAVVVARIRERLVEFCQTLWARTDEERRLVEETLHHRVAPPPPHLVKRLRLILETSPWIDPSTLPAADDLTAEDAETSESKAKSQDSKAGRGNVGSTRDQDEATTMASFGSAKDRGHVPLPALHGLLPGDDRAFVLQLPALFSERFLATCWRRLRLRTRAIPSRDLDVAATIRSIGRSGFLVHPVYQTTRQNTASLVLLIDVGPCMAPWRVLEQEFIASLHPSLSRLRSVTVRYFDSTPRRSVYAERQLRTPTPVDKFLLESRASPLLILGEAGAARGVSSQPQEKRLLAFLARARGHNARPVVWINPMPTPSWSLTPAAAIASSRSAVVLPLSREMMLRAVDILRGERAS